MVSVSINGSYPNVNSPIISQGIEYSVYCLGIKTNLKLIIGNMLLSDLKVGEKAIVDNFQDLAIEAVLTDMGCPLGTTVEIYHKGLFNGLISIKTNTGNILALRHSDAQQMRMRKS